MRYKRNDVLKAIVGMARAASPRAVQPVTELVQNFSLSRQQVARYLAQLCNSGILAKTGSGRGAAYTYLRGDEQHVRRDVAVDSLSLAETGKVVDEIIACVKPAPPRLLAATLRTILLDLFARSKEWRLDSKLRIRVAEESPSIIVTIADDGEGLFLAMQRRFQAASMLDAIGQLVKCRDEDKDTPALFRSLNAADFVTVAANGLIWEYLPRSMDWAVSRIDGAHRGTVVTIEVERLATRFLDGALLCHPSPSEPDTCHLIVAMCCQASTRVPSRHHARVLLDGSERFKKVIVDFRHVASVGMGFLEEIFLVFQGAHPTVTIEHRNMNDTMRSMLEKILKPWRESQRLMRQRLGF